MKRGFLLIVGVIAACAFLPACQPVTAEYEGKQRTSAQIEAQVEARLKEAAAQEAVEIAKAKLEAERLQRQAEREAAAAESEAKRAQQQAARAYAAELRKLNMQGEANRAELDERLAQVNDSIGTEWTLRSTRNADGLADGLADLKVAVESQRAQREAQVLGLQAMASAAIADIEAREAARGAWVNWAQGALSDPAVAGAVGGVPGGALLLGVLGSAMTLFGGVKFGQKTSEAKAATVLKTESDNSWQEGFEAGAKSVQAKMDEANSTWDEAEAAQERKKKDMLFDAMLQRLSGGLPVVPAAAEPAKAA